MDLFIYIIEAVQQSKNSGKRKTNRALNPKRSDIFMVKINCGTASTGQKQRYPRLIIDHIAKLITVEIKHVSE